MAKKPTLVAAVDIHGGSHDPAEKGAKPHVVRAGTKIDGDHLKKLGIGDDEVTRLIARGHIVEQGDFEPGGPATPQTAPGTTGTAFEGMTLDDMHAVLDEAGVKYPSDASPQDLMKIALGHGVPAPAGEGDSGGGASPGAAATAAKV